MNVYLRCGFCRDILPAELGGSAPPYNNASWAMQLVGDDSSFAFSDKQIFWPKDGGVSPHSPSAGCALVFLKVSNGTLYLSNTTNKLPFFPSSLFSLYLPSPHSSLFSPSILSLLLQMSGRIPFPPPTPKIQIRRLALGSAMLTFPKFPSTKIPARRKGILRGDLRGIPTPSVVGRALWPSSSKICWVMKLIYEFALVRRRFLAILTRQPLPGQRR